MTFKKFFTSLYFAVASFMLFDKALASKSSDSLKVDYKIELRQSDTAILLTLSITNVSSKSIAVHTELIQGYLFDRDVNLSLQIEKKEGKQYKRYPLPMYQKIFPSDSIDNIPKRLLNPKETINLTYDLTEAMFYEKGEYRVKGTYRNNLRKLDEFYESEWIPMKIDKFFKRKH